MRQEITIRCLNTGQSHTLAAGLSLSEILSLVPGIDVAGGAVCARVNNVVKGLGYALYSNKDVEFLGIDSAAGMRTYTRSLLFVMGVAVDNLYGRQADFSVEAPVSNGYYCRLSIGQAVDDDIVEAVTREMKRLIAMDLPFRRVTAPTKDVIELFESEDLMSKVRLLRSTRSLYSTYYTLDEHPDYYYGALLPSTGRLNLFGLARMSDGVLLRLPDPQRPGELRELRPQPKMLGVMSEHRQWQQIIGLSTIGDLNEKCAEGRASQLIQVSEALQEKKICKIAEAIQEKGTVRLVLIAGPSSSGKTTFSKRLSVQLAVCGIVAHPISMDDYFLDRDKTPRDADGNYDFECVEALNIPMLTDHMERLARGEEVELPRYDFLTGKNTPSGRRLRLGEKEVIVMEGIHALNPTLTTGLDEAIKYRVYVSALTTIQLDSHNYIPTTDNRLLRRIVRDAKYRNYTALDTISRWSGVRKGEDKWIFPYQENADAMFNSALLFELATLREQALPLLEQVPQDRAEYAEAYRLKKFLYYINPIDMSGLPPTSLLREFLGGSTFSY